MSISLYVGVVFFMKPDIRSLSVIEHEDIIVNLCTSFHTARKNCSCKIDGPVLHCQDNL